MMQSNFPRIYSLSTIGIKQHYNADYLFHSYRTDFSGESGSGKSMVSDMIQLLLVGSSDFKSSTDGNKQRDVKGMLASTKGKSSARGYIFMNIEVRPKRYIVMGAYIESTNNAAEMFIIQNGYNWDELTPLDKPVFTNALIIEDKVETLQALCEKITFARMKSFKRRNYHKTLYNNNIISLDLTKETTLKTYANILRSFSRGKGFRKESENLKKFLFGDEEQNLIMEKYREEVSNINNDFHEHKRYLEEIKLINEKQKMLQDLIDRNRAYKSTYAEYLVNNFNYWNTAKKRQVMLREEAEAGIAKKEIEIRFLELELLRLRITDLKEIFALNILISKHSSTDDDKDAAEGLFFSTRQIVSQVELVTKWLAEQGSLEKVEIWYNQQQKLKLERKKLTLFTDYLRSRQIEQQFLISGWLHDFTNENNAYHEKISNLESRISNLRSLSKFSDIENPESLLRWAMDNLTFPINREEESILHYYQKFGRTKPLSKPNNRYVSYPGELFRNVGSKLKDVAENGFWFDLDGVYEFIEYVPEPMLAVQDPTEILHRLSDISEGLATDIRKLTDEKKSHERLREILFNFSNLEEHIDVYKRRESIDEATIEPDIADFGEESFLRLKAVFENKEQHDLNFQKAKKDYEEIVHSKKAADDALAKIKALTALHFPTAAPSDMAHLDYLIAVEAEKLSTEESLLDAAIASGKLGEQLAVENFFRDINSHTILVSKKLQAESALTQLSLNAAQATKSIEKADDEIMATLDKNAELALELKFDPEAQETNNPQDGGSSSLKQKALESQTSFEEYLKIVIGKEHFDAGVTIGQLASHFLPTVFPKAITDESLIDFNIGERLHKLTQYIQEIGSRKIEILGSIFNQVYTVYNGYLTKITEIDNYLKNKKKIITGGNRASLTFKKSIHYPDSWLLNFRKQLNSHIGSTGLFSELKEELDINKMMIQAFQQLGGSSKVEPEDLMNPLSYFDLEFDLKLDNDEVNSGSNGQTYAANALLCLARLYLIQDKPGGLKIMPIDEAEGLGSNYDMLHELAKNERYQIVTMAIETAGEIKEGDQYIYIMNENKGSDIDSYVPPFGIFSDTVIEDISTYINTLANE